MTYGLNVSVQRMCPIQLQHLNAMCKFRLLTSKNKVQPTVAGFDLKTLELIILC